jgi:prophage antirepressor-like protein
LEVIALTHAHPVQDIAKAMAASKHELANAFHRSSSFCDSNRDDESIGVSGARDLSGVRFQSATRSGKPINQTSARRSDTMSDGLMCITSNFEGRPLSTLTYKGRPAWIAREVGALLGYSHGGKRLANKITGDWSDEFIEGHDFEVLDHNELSIFKELLELGTDSVPSRAPSMVILFESGLHLVLAKTSKPIGQRLRRFIVDEVLPQIVRDGAYLPERRVEDGQLVSADATTFNPRIAREQRLARRLELEDRKFKVQTLRHTIKDIKGTVSPEAITILQVVAAEIALELDLSDLKFDRGLYLYSPSAVNQIEERLRIEGHLDAAEVDFN